MEEPSPHEIRNTVVAALVGLLGGLGAGIATMAGPQAFPGAPLWLWQCLFWIGIVTFFGAAAYLFYEYRVRPRRAGKPKLDPLLIFALVATLVLAGSLFMMMLRGAQVQASIGASPQAESKQRPVFLRDLTVYADSAAEHSVWLTGTATATKKNLQVLVEYSLTFGNRPQNWEPMQRVHIGSLPDLVKGVSVQFPLAVRSNVDGQQRFFWGDPKNNMTVAHSPIYNPLGVSRVRLIIADADQEQDSYFMVVLMPNENLANRFILIPETELKWVQEWKAKANGR